MAYLGITIPDLVIGCIVSVVIMRAGIQIKHEARELQAHTITKCPEAIIPRETGKILLHSYEIHK